MTIRLNTRFSTLLISNIFLTMLLSFLLCAPALARTNAIVPVAPMAWLLAQVGGDDVEIQTLVPPGASPHSFEVRPRQMADLATAQLFFTLNMPLETQIQGKLLERSPDLKVVDLNRGITLRYFSHEEEEFEEHHHHADEDMDEHHDADEEFGEGHQHEAEYEHSDLGNADPHTWLNPQNAKIQAANMAEALAALHPERASFYQANLKVVQDKLSALDNQLSALLAPYKGQSFLVYHPAFGYLADHYGLKQVAVEMEGKEPTPRRLAALIEQARDYGVKIIFVQPQFSKAAVNRLAEELAIKVVVMDPLAYDYPANLEAIIKSLQAGFD